VIFRVYVNLPGDNRKEPNKQTEWGVIVPFPGKLWRCEALLLNRVVYPQIIDFLRGFSIGNHPAIGDPLFMETT